MISHLATSIKEKMFTRGFVIYLHGMWFCIPSKSVLPHFPLDNCIIHQYTFLCVQKTVTNLLDFMLKYNMRNKIFYKWKKVMQNLGILNWCTYTRIHQKHNLLRRIVYIGSCKFILSRITLKMHLQEGSIVAGTIHGKVVNLNNRKIIITSSILQSQDHSLLGGYETFYQVIQQKGPGQVKRAAKNVHKW